MQNEIKGLVKPEIANLTAFIKGHPLNFSQKWKVHDEWSHLKDYIGQLEEALAALINAKEEVEKLLPDGDEINKAADEYGFRIPYDGSNKFYDEEAIKHFLAGVRFVEHHIEESISAKELTNNPQKLKDEK